MVTNNFASLCVIAAAAGSAVLGALICVKLSVFLRFVIPPDSCFLSLLSIALAFETGQFRFFYLVGRCAKGWMVLGVVYKEMKSSISEFRLPVMIKRRVMLMK